jgi:hypothetical protein
MLRHPLSRPAILAVLLAAALAACHRAHDRAHDRPHAAVDAERPTGSLAATDLGVSMLADVDNARAAIAAHDAMAAANDVNQAIDYAVRLPDVNSALYPNDAIQPNRQAGKTGAAALALTSFDTEVVLTTAQSAIEAGDLADADTDLAAIQQRTPPRLVPADLPLLRADESLDLARIAVESEHPAELATQLSIAETALGAYQGGAHAGDAHALATAIQIALKRPGALDHLQPDQLDVWSKRVDGWG